MLNEKKIKEAFHRAKMENHALSQWIFYLKERIDELSLSLAQFSHLQEELSELKKKEETKETESKIESPNSSVNLHKSERVVHQTISEFSPDLLTELQRKTFFLIGSLQREHGTQYIPVRTINAELYGPHTIEKMQTTVANYLKRLEELQLIKRIKKGRNSFVSLSECGLQVLASHHIEGLKPSVIIQ